MASASPNSSFTLPVPQPRSPPKYPDLYGKHRKQAELQYMNREIDFLEEELQSIERLPTASRCCKEVDDFVGTNPDPLIPQNRKIRRSFRIWKWLRTISCFSCSWICCTGGCCSIHLKRLRCCSCDWTSKWRCCCHPHCCNCCCYCCCCLEKFSCRRCCVLPTLPSCVLPKISCPDCSCGCSCSCPRCPKVCCYPKCAGDCCVSCYNCLSSCLCY